MSLGVKVDLKKQYNEAEICGKKGIKKAFMLDVSFEIENELVVLFWAFRFRKDHPV
jgi:molybdate transport system ATP-binding protein